MVYSAPDELESRIAERIDPFTGHITMFLSDVPGGPIMTGKTREEALRKMRQAMPVYRIATLYVLSIDNRMN